MSADLVSLSPPRDDQPPGLLAVLPNGEAVRAAFVRSVSIKEQVGMIGQEDTLYRVVVDLDDDSTRVVARNLSPADATDVARRTGRLINEALRIP